MPKHFLTNPWRAPRQSLSILLTQVLSTVLHHPESCCFEFISKIKTFALQSLLGKILVLSFRIDYFHYNFIGGQLCAGVLQVLAVKRPVRHPCPLRVYRLVEGKAMQTSKQGKLSLPGLCRGGRENDQFWRKSSDSEGSATLSLGKRAAIYQADKERSHSRFQFST